MTELTSSVRKSDISKYSIPVYTKHASADCICWCRVLHAVHDAQFSGWIDHAGSLSSLLTVHTVTAVKHIGNW